MNTPTYKKKFEQHKPLLQYLSEKTGKQFNNTYDISELYFTFCTEVNDCVSFARNKCKNFIFLQLETGHKLPKWTTKVFPELMLQATADEYASRAANDEMKRLTSGTFNVTNTTLFLSLSLHDNNIVAVFIFAISRYFNEKDIN